MASDTTQGAGDPGNICGGISTHPLPSGSVSGYHVSAKQWDYIFSWNDLVAPSGTGSSSSNFNTILFSFPLISHFCLLLTERAESDT